MGNVERGFARPLSALQSTVDRPAAAEGVEPDLAGISLGHGVRSHESQRTSFSDELASAKEEEGDEIRVSATTLG